ncbi:hypothetical protein CDL15_Pgr009762 [Punica granatum]|uniref:Uncharacterized protein n=1 Tax=Punica granatum TaxID=22663 RepID=A0A218WU55_PUNGR|nr:hypothetical protein CDL15_Pgr009762 [Punica granatum]PKI77128.1 hypothetical protein CRG98_002631 [Punica granatum]
MVGREFAMCEATRAPRGLSKERSSWMIRGNTQSPQRWMSKDPVVHGNGSWAKLKRERADRDDCVSSRLVSYIAVASLHLLSDE